MKRHTRYAVQYSKGQYSVVEYTTVLTAALRATGEPAHQVTLSHRRHAINPLRGGAVQSAMRVRVCQCGTLQYSPPPAHHVRLQSTIQCDSHQPFACARLQAIQQFDQLRCMQLRSTRQWCQQLCAACGVSGRLCWCRMEELGVGGSVCVGGWDGGWGGEREFVCCVA